MWRKQTGKIRNLRFITEDYIYYTTFYNYVITTATRGPELCSRLGLCLPRGCALQEPNRSTAPTAPGSGQEPAALQSTQPTSPVPSRTHTPNFFGFRTVPAACPPGPRPQPQPPGRSGPGPGRPRPCGRAAGRGGGGGPGHRRCVLG